MQSREHWENVYTSIPENEVSWFQQHAQRSIKLIRKHKPEKASSIIDVGGGASTLVDDLLEYGYSKVSVLDLSQKALAKSRLRLGAMASKVNWITANITRATLPENEFDVWHDRAVFHFLTSKEERLAYVKQVQSAVKPASLVVVATFAEDGPESCSGLPVNRYSASALRTEFGELFVMLDHEHETHLTPSGKEQRFVYCCFKRIG